MRYLTFIPLLLLILATPLHATEYEGVYRAEVEVPNSGRTARAEGMQQAMAEVLLKAAGTSRVHDSSALVEATHSASRYVQQYRYHNEQNDGDSTTGERLMLSVRFDQNGIDGLLRKNGFTVWGTARPSALIWMGVEQKNRRVLVGANDGGFVRQRIEEEAKRRGLPVKLPLLDLKDRSRVQPGDVWGGFLDTIESASARYASQAILVGRLNKANSSTWEARWTLSYLGKTHRWQHRSGQVGELIEQGIGHTTELLLTHFSQSLVGGSGSMQLEVLGVHNLKQYRRVVDYLSGVHGVRGVLTEQITPDAARFSLETEGGSEAVLQIIALGDVLEPEEIPQSSLLYRAIPRKSDEGGQQAALPQPPLRVYRLNP